MSDQVTAHKDVVITLLGASAGLGGLALVFLGFVLATYQGFDADTPKKVLARYRRAADVILVAFGVGLLCLVLATCWLILVHPPDSLYVAVVVFFFTQLVSLLGAAVFAVYRLFR